MGNNKVDFIDGTVLGGVTAGAYRTAPWHGRGLIYDAKENVIGEKKQLDGNPRTTDEIIDLASLDWEPERVPLNTLMPNLVSSTSILIRNGWPTAHDHYQLGVHSDKYGVIKNRVGVDFISEILSLRDDGMLQSVTTLYGGQIAFGVIKFHDGIEVTRHNGSSLDRHTQYLGVYWSHDGRFPLGVRFMRHEWVCENTFTPWNAIGGLTVRHTRHANDHATFALATMDKMMTSMTEFDEELRKLMQIDISKDEMIQHLHHPSLLGQRPEPKVFATLEKGVSTKDNAGKHWDAKFDAIVAEWEDFTDNSTAFDFVMAIQGFEQHRERLRGTNRDAKNILRLLRDDWPMTNAAVRLVSA